MDFPIRSYTTNRGLHSSGEGNAAGCEATSLPDDGEQSSAPHIKEGEPQTEALTSQPESVSHEEVERVDVAEFEAIFLRFQTPISNFIYHLIGNREQAYDLTQDVFVKAYKALLAGTTVQPRALSAWLYRIAANTATDTLRRRRLISWLPLSLFNEDRGIGAGVVSESGGTASENFANPGEESVLESKSGSTSTLYERGGYDGGMFESRIADREIVQRIFQKLPDKYSSCLWLYENDGFSCAEIAEILNISASAVKMRLMRAREQFITLYKQEVSDK